MCGFNEIERDEKVARAHQILNSTELKQAICHKILGTTFKDVEKAMEGVLKERQLSPDQEEELELRDSHPEKYEGEFYPDVEFKKNKDAADPVKNTGYTTYSKYEVAELMAASSAEYTPSEPEPMSDYPTYSREHIEQFMFEHWEHIENQKKRKQEKEWDSTKTTESVLKIKPATKPTTSSKDSKI